MSPTTSLRNALRGLPVFDVELSSFDTEAVPDEPRALFLQWLGAAIDADAPEPHAMTLSTSDTDGRPDARILILKDLDETGWWFATDSRSAKGLQLSARPWAALTFYWPSLGRQVRVRGPVVQGTAEASAQDFLARGTGARSVVPAGQVSPTWKLYAVTADEVEFWQADRDRRHARLRYRREEANWTLHPIRP